MSNNKKIKTKRIQYGNFLNSQLVDTIQKYGVYLPEVFTEFTRS
jgi:hypothetical protein